jgi:hypothetical protein
MQFQLAASDAICRIPNEPSNATHVASFTL